VATYNTSVDNPRGVLFAASLQVGGVRVRQHSNPLKRELQVIAELASSLAASCRASAFTPGAFLFPEATTASVLSWADVGLFFPLIFSCEQSI
jgi:hypothetical protein